MPFAQIDVNIFYYCIGFVVKVDTVHEHAPRNYAGQVSRSGDLRVVPTLTAASQRQTSLTG